MAANVAKKPKSQISERTQAAVARVQRIFRVLLPLAIGTALLILGVFFSWQAFLVWSEETGASEADTVRASAITAINATLRQTMERVEGALATPDVLGALAQGPAGYGAAADALAKALPDLKDVEFYSPALDEIIKGDLAKFGYAKAQMLMQAKSSGVHAPLQARLDKIKGTRLVVALPVKNGNATVAFAVVYLPFEPVLRAFRTSHISGARLDLRQGDGRGDILLGSIGAGSGNSLGDLGEPIQQSLLRIGKGDPDYFIVGSFSLGTLTTLALLCLLGGAIGFWLRHVGMQRAMATLRFAPKTQAPEITLAEALKQAPEAAASAAKTAAPPKPGAPARPSKPKDAPVNIDRSIFRAYDIRGVVGETLTPAVARALGRAIGSEARERGLKEIVVGRDGRLSGPDMVAGLVEGLRATGMDVIDIGSVPTPVVYFGCYHLQTGSGISVTGSHNPPDYNGFKIVLGGETLSEDAIQSLYTRIAEERFVDGAGGLQMLDITQDYVQRITNDIQVERKLKVVVDCGNGIPGAIAPRVIEGIGCEVEPLYCEVDGTFPNHHPDPSDLHNLQDLILSVKQLNADIGLAFDGDGDRLGVVTKTGEVIFPDRLLMLFATDILTRNPGATIIYDVKCTGHLQPLILQHGGSPLMWRTGHSLIKAKMKETDAALAGEMSGHFFFGERWYGFDDGIYAAARLLDILGSDPEGRDAQQIFDTLPKGVSTPELKIPMREGEHYRFIEAFRKRAQFTGARITTIDGVRADWPDGWGLVRASNTTPVLVLRFDADTPEALKRVQDVFRAELLKLDSSLPLPF
jgi:phosphomannomutase/phosphoglucomutase